MTQKSEYLVHLAWRQTSDAAPCPHDQLRRAPHDRWICNQCGRDATDEIHVTAVDERAHGYLLERQRRDGW